MSEYMCPAADIILTQAVIWSLPEEPSDFLYEIRFNFGDSFSADPFIPVMSIF